MTFEFWNLLGFHNSRVVATVQYLHTCCHPNLGVIKELSVPHFPLQNEAVTKVLALGRAVFKLLLLANCLSLLTQPIKSNDWSDYPCQGWWPTGARWKDLWGSARGTRAFLGGQDHQQQGRKRRVPLHTSAHPCRHDAAGRSLSPAPLCYPGHSSNI